MKRRRPIAHFEQPSMVPMADMLTNTVGIMLFILVFVSLSAGGAIFSKRLPKEKATQANPVWLYCSGGRMVHFEHRDLAKEMSRGLGEPGDLGASVWAERFSSQTLETQQLEVSGSADVNGESGRLELSVAVRRRGGAGEDQAAVKEARSLFGRLLDTRNKKTEFLFFFVDPESIGVFRNARDRAVMAGFEVGWAALAADKPARIQLSGEGGSEPRVQ